MKKTVSLLLALVFVFGGVFVMNACGSKKDKETKVEIPKGYVVYKNEALSFAYPEGWTKTDGSTVTLAAENGNNITVVYENKTDTYEKMTTESYKTDLIPFYEQMGLSVTNPKVEQTKTNGLSITKITHVMDMNGTKMDQTQYITTIGEKTYTVTVTEIESDAKLVQTVFDTLCAVK